MKRSLATLVLTASLLTGCTGGSDTAATTASAGSAGSAADAPVPVEAAGPAGGAAPDTSAPLGRTTPLTAAVVRTGELEVLVPDVAAAADDAARLVAAAGGQVEADDRARDGGPQRAVDLASLSLRLTAQDSLAAAAGGRLGFGDGLREGLDALRAVGRAVGVTAGALLPWSPVLLVAGALVWRARRRPAGTA